MNKEQVAALLNNKEYPPEISKELRSDLISNKLVVVYGFSDDQMQFDGYLYDEISVYDGGFAFIKDNNLLSDEVIDATCHSNNPKEVVEEFGAKNVKVIEAIWSERGDFLWTYKTDIPHETFDILRDGRPFCRGIVFSLNHLESGDLHLKSLKQDAFKLLDEAVSKLHEYACECELGDERIKAFAIYQAARLAPLAN